ncbi:16S rRNA (guanine(966)-N(2))-methyltransferase RsmD [Liquorilactobacillus cacaonum]|uniref:Methyltransferase n=1 Tax=Liquorilactobacillus cacaonum DSM 21116 TaxID=1423729 RepID=A0A0R2CRJ5_9LACO|nr:16S rRNA (guanine(966)-N(2))-methyltransferase RsmD [Liquorilactobacillus cacaonum]KRM90758.1 methyltransferase [Liquorilactobacillus cacaonum DSM 21116]
MRVIAGVYGGRRLKAVPGMKTRPTTDKVKESMFNIIGPYFSGGVSLDLFAGSGGLSIEAVSRGVDHAYLVDRQYQAIRTINENIEITKEPNKFSVFKNDAERILEKLHNEKIKIDYLFLDPPYKEQKIMLLLSRIVSLNLLNKDAIVVCETDQDAHLTDNILNFELKRRADYGITEVIVYQYRGE